MIQHYEETACICPVEGLRDAPDTGAAWGVISDQCSAQARDRECSGLVTGALSQLGSTPGAECYGWTLPGVTPHTGHTSDQSEAR